MTRVATTRLRVGLGAIGEIRSAWQRRVVLVGGAFEGAFGALWLARGLAPVLPLGVRVGTGALVLALALAVAMLLRHHAPQPRGAAARRTLHRLTVATVLQLVASCLLPIVVATTLGPRLVLPSIVVTIGILLLWLHREVETPYQGAAGWALIGVAVVSAFLVGNAETVFVGLGSAAVLLGSSGAGFRWLHVARAGRDGPTAGLSSA